MIDHSLISSSLHVCSHEVRLNLLFASAAEMALNGVDSTVSPEATLFATYVRSLTFSSTTTHS